MRHFLTRSRRVAVAASLIVTTLVVAAGAAAPTTADSSPEPRSGSGTTAQVVSDELTNPASKYTPINPERIVDTRIDPEYKRLYNATAMSIDPISGTGVAALAGVNPDDITAVAVNTTFVEAGGIGFGTVWPTGGARPFTSTNNTVPGSTTPNLVIATLGLDRKISVYTSANVDVILDVVGVFSAAQTSSDGRFVALPPVRAIDSRDPGVPDLAPDQEVTFDLTPFGVPADASAAVLNLTSVRGLGPGFYRVWAAGDDEPEHSNVNVVAANTDTSNQVITKVTNGQIKIVAPTGGGYIIDVTGYFTGSSAAPSSDGLYVPFTPARLLDTREPSGPTGLNGGNPLQPSQQFDLQVDGRFDIPDGAAQAVAFNLTGTESSGPGFVNAWAVGAPSPATSALNTSGPNQTVPNHAITSMNPNIGSVRFIAAMRVHLVVDVSGYFLAPGAPVPAGSSAVNRTVSPGSFVPAPLSATEPPEAPYDFIIDRSIFASTGIRPTPTRRAAWLACGPTVLRYAINIDLARNNAQIAALITAVEDVERFTGIDFQFAGVTSAGMNIDAQVVTPENFGLPHQYLPADDDGTGLVDLVIGFSSGADTPRRGGGVIGIGGAVPITSPDANGFQRLARGFAVIDLADLTVDGPAGDRTLDNIRGTMRHEIGHMMGLGHVNLPNSGFGPGLAAPQFSGEALNQLMFPALAFRFTFNTGDIHGFWQLYANQTACSSNRPAGDELVIDSTPFPLEIRSDV